jgi:hypothetical protein
MLDIVLWSISYPVQIAPGHANRPAVHLCRLRGFARKLASSI